MFAGFSGDGNSIHNITPLLKKEKRKENVDLYPCPLGHNNYADAYFLSSWEDVALEVTMSYVKSTDVTCKTHSGTLAVQLPWLVNLAILVCDMDWWLSCRVLALQSVVAGSISSGGDHSIHSWWDLIRLKQLSSVSVCYV